MNQRRNQYNSLNTELLVKQD